MADIKDTNNNSIPEVTDILEALEVEGPANSKESQETILVPVQDPSKVAPLPWEEGAEEGISINNIIQDDSKTLNLGENQEINLLSLEDIVSKIQDKEYDYVLIEPEETKVKVTFRENNSNKATTYIKFATYTNILLKIKQLAGLVVENTWNTQEWKWKLTIWKKNYILLTKTVPWKNGERIWLKTKLNTQTSNEVKKKVPLSTILWFFAAIFFVMLILGWSFISFIVINAKTVDDVQFFSSLGISLNDINSFISQIVTIIFSILLFILTLILSVCLFKFFLTKKVFKRKKILYALLSVFLLIITFSTATAWMYVDQKIKQLPNWQEQAYGDLKIFDNALLVSPDFSDSEALLSETKNLIWPVNLNFDLTNFQNNQERSGLTINKYVWNFWGTVVESFTPVVIQSFDRVWNYEIRVEAIGIDRNGQEVVQELTSIPTVSISHIVKYTETITNNWWKKVAFDASSIKDIWSVKWYFKSPKTDNETVEYEEWSYNNDGFEFIPGKIFFETMYIWLSVLRNGSDEESIDKVFVIQAEIDGEMSWEISYEASLENDLEYEFSVLNPQTSFSNWFIEKYDWKIWDRSYSLTSNLEKSNQAPVLTHVFQNYWEKNVSVVMTDSLWKTFTLNSTITLQKDVELKEFLIITNEATNEQPSNLKYETRSHEYFIDEIWVPSTLKFDARYVRPTNISYSLDTVSWDVWNDKDIESTGKNYTLEVGREWNNTLAVTYNFKHRRNTDDIISLTEFIYIQAVKKDAILSLEIENSSNYAPVSVRFDASKSYIKDDNIIKFVYDYWDWIVEERDAINPGHRYAKAWDYTIKLTVIWQTGKEFSLEKKLILLPAPQDVKISPSLKRAPVDQWIDFSSAESAGQIIEYFWDFGDGNISTDANPSHAYTKAWFYTVTLRADFVNNNSISDTIEVEIIEKK